MINNSSTTGLNECTAFPNELYCIRGGGGIWYMSGNGGYIDYYTELNNIYSCSVLCGND